MRRREFIALLGGAAAWPLAARAQQPSIPVVGYLSARAPTQDIIAGFRRGLTEHGYVEGETVLIEYRWAFGQYDRLLVMAAELARRPVAVIATGGGESSALAAKAASPNIPIVFSIGGDPVKLGLVASYNRPGGNVTGIDILTSTLEAKRVELLHQMVPHAAAIGVLLNPNNPPSQAQLKEVQEAGRAIGLQIDVLWVGTDREIDAAFETIVQRRIAALAVTAGPFFDTHRDKLVALAARHALPTMYHLREFAAAGGLISYGVDSADAYRQVGAYVGRILKGEKAAELPVLQPTTFELVINLKTAKAFGIEIPPNLLARADEVIE